MADLIDPTQTGNYPVVLSPRLLNQSSDDIFTSVRYNHKPSSIPEPSHARLKPSIPGQTSSYDLNVLSSSKGSTTHAYAGTRTTGNGKYVLYFEPDKQRFVLDRIDSTFHMNLTRTPETSDPEALSRRYPHIDGEGKKAAKKEAKKEAKQDRPKSPVRKKEKKEFATKSERRRAKDANNLALPTGGVTPTPAASSSQPKSKSKAKAEEEDDDEDDGDDLLLVEYPGAKPTSQSRDYSPALHSVRKFDDFMDQRESEADDADDESLNESDADFKLPSPVNHPAHESEAEAMDVDEEEEEREEDARGGSDMEDDLEKDLAEAFETAGNEGSSPAPREDQGDESEISEED